MKKTLSAARHIGGAVLVVAFGAAVGEVLLFPEPLRAAPQECCARSECGPVFNGQAYCQASTESTNCVLGGGGTCSQEACTGPVCQQ